MASTAATGERDLFWGQIEQTPSSYLPDNPVIVQGKLIAPNAAKLRDEMFSSCILVDPYAREFFQSPPEKVLDLGSGSGVNTRPMAHRGAHVTAIDSSKKLLQTFAKQCASEGCPKENIRLRRGDITATQSYGENFDLVVAVDILPYIEPKNLRATMEKIQKCLADNGILIGSIFTTDLDPTMRSCVGQLGAHFYEGGREFVQQLITESGFVTEKLEARQEGGFRFKAVKISNG